MKNNNDISIRIKTVRESINENLSEFARSLDIPRSTLVGYENGSTIPAYFLALIAKKYNISEDWLLSGIGDMKKQGCEHNPTIPNSFGLNRLQKQPKNTDEQTQSTNCLNGRKPLSDEKVNKLSTNNEEQPQSTITNAPLSENFHTNRLKSYPTCRNSLSDKKANNLADLSERLENEPNNRTNIRTVESKDSFDIQTNIEELARKANAPQFNKISKQLENLESRLNRLERLKNQGNLPDEVKESAVSYGIPEEDEPMTELPLAYGLAAGLPVEACDSGEVYLVPTRFLKKRKNYCVAKISGTSMTEAGIEDGSYVLLEYSSAGCDDCIAVVTYEGTTTLKRLHQNSDGSWELRYEDGSGAIIPLKAGQWEVSGLFVRVL